MTSVLWHSIPGRLQSVSVATKSNIWGVTLDLQLCKLNPETLQWQLVSVTSEPIDCPRVPGISAKSGQITPSSTSPSKKILSPFKKNNVIDGHSDQDSDSTFQVSAAGDGTVVRLDKSLRTWYLVGSQNRVDFENDILWIDLGHFWKCISVASVSQIWGLSDNGDIYYGTSDRFVQLGPPVTSGAGYHIPKFTQISVGQDNLVIATDSHTGTVFRLKTHPTSSHPPVWTALEGTGPGTTIHMMNCSLSSADFIVGLSKDGQVYRRCNGNWIPIGGQVKLCNIDVGVDGYVIGIDRDGDLYACQLQNTVAVPRRDPSQNALFSRNKDEDPYRPNSPQAPNLPNLPSTPRVQTISKRPAISSRELFERGSSDRGSRGSSSPSLNRSGESYIDYTSISGYNTPARNTFGRTDTQASYASEMGHSTPTTPLSGLNIAQLQRGDSLSKTIANRITPLQIHSRGNHSREGSGGSYRGPEDSYFMLRPSFGSVNDTPPSAHSLVSKKRNSADSRRSSRLALGGESFDQISTSSSSSSSSAKSASPLSDTGKNLGQKHELKNSSESLEPHRNINNTIAAANVVSTTGDLTSRTERTDKAELPDQDSAEDLVSDNGPKSVDNQSGIGNANIDNSLHISAPSPRIPFSADQFPKSISEAWQKPSAPPAPVKVGHLGDELRNSQQFFEDEEGNTVVPNLKPRLSDASDILMQQQQEFLRLTRLRSNSSSVPGGDVHNGVKEANNVAPDSSNYTEDDEYKNTFSRDKHSSLYGNSFNGPRIIDNSNGGPYGNTHGPYGNNFNSPIVNGSGPYTINNSPLINNGRPNGSPYGNNINDPRFINRNGPNGINSPNTMSSPNINKESGPYRNNNSGPYGNNPNAQFSNNVNGSPFNDVNIPHANRPPPNRPPGNNANGPYGNNTNGPPAGPYGNNFNRPPPGSNINRPPGNSPYGVRPNGPPYGPPGNNLNNSPVRPPGGPYGNNLNRPPGNNMNSPYAIRPNGPLNGPPGINVNGLPVNNFSRQPGEPYINSPVNNANGPYGNNPNRPPGGPYANNGNNNNPNSNNPYNVHLNNNNNINSGSLNIPSKMEYSADDGPMQRIGPYGGGPAAISTSAAFNTEPQGNNAGLVARRGQYAPNEIGSEASSRPSYSSSHLQQCVDNSLSSQPGGADVKNGAIVGNGTADTIGTSAVAGSSKPQSTSQGGIQGEDAQGRWVGGDTTSNRPITNFDPEVRKSKCCVIQ
ncbi:hypothetical protein BGZ46_005047 [Entomortierella lignicola]|nr:hypothetical protein BGZ46_005047 [Entomortierella lignicola]